MFHVKCKAKRLVFLIASMYKQKRKSLSVEENGCIIARLKNNEKNGKLAMELFQQYGRIEKK